MPLPWSYGYVPTPEEWYQVLLEQVGPQGPTGPVGPTGAAGPAGADAPVISWLYSTSTIDSNPGSTYARFDNSDLSLATEVYLSNDASGPLDVSAWLDTFDDFGDASSRG